VLLFRMQHCSISRTEWRFCHSHDSIRPTCNQEHAMHLRLILSIALFFAVPALAQHAAHEHGVADLRVAAEGNTVVIEFDSPLDNLVGFEHAPRDDAQRMALRTAEKRL